MKDMERQIDELIARHDGVTVEEITLEYIRKRRGNCNDEYAKFTVEFPAALPAQGDEREP